MTKPDREPDDERAVEEGIDTPDPETILEENSTADEL
jgi:hypothetical protein